MLLAQGFYPNPVPGFIVTAIVCAVAAGVAIWIAIRNFGPAAKRQAASEAWKAAADSPAGPAVAAASMANTTTGAKPRR